MRAGFEISGIFDENCPHSGFWPDSGVTVRGEEGGGVCISGVVGLGLWDYFYSVTFLPPENRDAKSGVAGWLLSFPRPQLVGPVPGPLSAGFLGIIVFFS